MPKKFLNFKLFLALALLSISLNSLGNNFLEEDLEKTEISLLTCDPGNEIYSLFGHSALRINNQKLKIDMVVNWGLFSFSEGQNLLLGLENHSNEILKLALENGWFHKSVPSASIAELYQEP